MDVLLEVRQIRAVTLFVVAVAGVLMLFAFLMSDAGLEG